MTPLLAHFVVGCLSVLVTAAPEICDLKSLDEAAKDIIFFAGSGHEPATKEELLKACPTYKESLGSAEMYAEKCMTGLGQAMTKIFLEGAGAETTAKCDEANERHQAYVKHVPCVLGVGDQVHKCNKIIAAVLEVAKEASPKTRIGEACCFVSDYEDCVMSAVSKCGPEVVEYSKSVIEAYAGELLHSVCRKWTHGSKECLSLPKLKPHEKPTYQTLLPPLVEVLQTLT